MSFSAAQLRACMAQWMRDELREPDAVMRLVLRRRARDFGADGGAREFLESLALRMLAAPEPLDSPASDPETAVAVLLAEAARWASEAIEITRDVVQASPAQKDFGVESLVLLGRSLSDALRLGAASEERVQHALWWKLHLLGDEERSRFWHWKGRARDVRPGFSRETAHVLRDALRAELKPWCARATAALEAALGPALMRLRAHLAAQGWKPAAPAAVPSAAGQETAPYSLLEVPDPMSKRSGKVSPWAVRCSFPFAVAAQVSQLIASGTRPEHVVLLMPPEAPPHAWADHARALSHAGVAFAAPWGPAWKDMVLVRAWSQVLAFAAAPESPLARYALLVGPTFGAPDTLQLEALEPDLTESLARLSEAGVQGALVLFDAWVCFAPIAVSIEHLHGAAWLRSALGLIRAELVLSIQAVGDSVVACAADLQDALRRDWDAEHAEVFEGAVRLQSAAHYVPSRDVVMFVCEPTTAVAIAKRVSGLAEMRPREWVLASVQGTPVEGWGRAVLHGEPRAMFQAAKASAPALGDLVRAELLRAPG